MNRDQQFNFMAIMCVLLGLLVVLLAVTSRSGGVVDSDYEALQEAYDELHEGYNELQTDYTKAVERIEYLEYELESDEE